MGGAPVIRTIRPGVAFTPAAAASFLRAEAEWGRPIRCNSSYRDYGLQLSMYQAWTAWTEGRGPKPNHSMAVHPDYSKHCAGLALDTPDYTVPGFIAMMARHGWIRTAASNPTELHHFEYQSWNDKHRFDPAPAGEPQEDEMNEAQEKKLDALREAVQGIVNAIGDPSIGLTVAANDARDDTRALRQAVQGIANAVNDSNIGLTVVTNDTRDLVRKLSLGGVDVNVLAAAIRSTLPGDVVDLLAKRLAS